MNNALINMTRLLYQLKQKNIELENKSKELQNRMTENEENIIATMLACAELYELLLFSVETYDFEGGKDTVVKFANGMINIYVTLIKKGLKTIDDIPEKLKQQVIEELEKEE